MRYQVPLVLVAVTVAVMLGSALSETARSGTAQPAGATTLPTTLPATVPTVTGDEVFPYGVAI